MKISIGGFPIEVIPVDSLCLSQGVLGMLISPGALEMTEYTFPDGHKEIREKYNLKKAVLMQNIGCEVGS